MPEGRPRLAILGIKGIPARFGGFETAVDQTASRLSSDLDITVYNRSNHPAGPIRTHNGIRIRTLWSPRSKHLSTIVHAGLATLDAIGRRTDIFHYYTAGTAPLGVLPKLLGKRVVVSVDGLDWQRSKWGRFPRAYIRACERIACRIADEVVTDADVLRDYYRETYGRETRCLAYGGDLPPAAGDEELRRFGLEPGQYYLFVGRLVPENCIHELLEGWRRVNSRRRLVIVGDDPWETEYKARLKELADDRVVFTGYVFGEGYVRLLEHCYAYVFPDAVGGTHPALVEAMGAGCAVLANGTAANREVLGGTGLTYDPDDPISGIVEGFARLEGDPGLVADLGRRARARAEQEYTWARVAAQHLEMYRALLDRDRRRAVASHDPGD